MTQISNFGADMVFHKANCFVIYINYTDYAV